MRFTTVASITPDNDLSYEMTVTRHSDNSKTDPVPEENSHGSGSTKMRVLESRRKATSFGLVTNVWPPEDSDTLEKRVSASSISHRALHTHPVGAPTLSVWGSRAIPTPAVGRAHVFGPSTLHRD